MNAKSSVSLAESGVIDNVQCVIFLMQKTGWLFHRSVVDLNPPATGHLSYLAALSWVLPPLLQWHALVFQEQKDGGGEMPVASSIQSYLFYTVIFRVEYLFSIKL